VATTGLMRDARKHARRGKTRAARGASKVSKGISQKTTKNDDASSVQKEYCR
jgi:hypothetical protein